MLSKQRTGLCQVYVCHSEGFSGRLRPAYDSAPIAIGELTSKQVQTLISKMHRYIFKCREKAAPPESTAIRHAFTLIELLVAIGVLLFLAALGAYFLPRIKSDTAAATAGDRLQGWLVIAKQRAKRDQLPTGLRLLPGDPSTPLLVTRLQYVQQPESDFTGQVNVALVWGPDPAGDPAKHIPLLYRGDAGGTAILNLLSVGDYLRFNDGPAHLVTSIDTVARTFDLPVDDGFRPPTTPAFPVTTTQILPDFGTFTPTLLFHLYRQTQPLAGEQILALPDGVTIDLGTNGAYGVAVGSQPWDIMFNARGQVVSGGTAIKYLWLRDATEEVPAGSQVFARPQQLITIIGASGFIGAFPINTSIDPVNPLRYLDPYSFTRDPRSTGM